MTVWERQDSNPYGVITPMEFKSIMYTNFITFPLPSYPGVMYLYILSYNSAEREGFEPPDQLLDHGLANHYINQLCHLSLPSLFYPRFPVTHGLMTRCQIYITPLYY